MSERSPWWNGQPHSLPPGSPASAYSLPPRRSIVGAADVTAENTDGSTSGLKSITFPDYCGWAFVEEDGGALLSIYPQSGGGTPSRVRAGAAVWIGDGRLHLAYSGPAPTSNIVITGCTSFDVLIYATQSASGSGLSSAQNVSDASTVVSPKFNDPAPIFVTGSAPGIQMRVTFEPNYLNMDPDDRLWLTSDPNGLHEGEPIAPGGEFDWTGALYVSFEAAGAATSVNAFIVFGPNGVT